MDAIKDKGCKTLILVICLMFCASFAFAQTLPPYQKMYPAPDVNKSGTVSPDNSCWMATASNMLAGAGYGNGNTVQARADDIYQDMIAHYGVANGGWIDDALSWWLSSANNVWPDNLYDNVVMYGSYSKIPLNDSNLPRTVANELRDCQLVGLSISWDSGGSVPGTGGHAITCWGDDSTDPNPLTSNPSQVIVTDSDSGVGEQTYNYNWQTYTYGAGTTTGWELSYSSTPFIKHYTVLYPVPEGYIARGTRKIHQTMDTPATDLHFTAYQKEPNIFIQTYRQTIDQPYGSVSVTESDHGMGDGEIHAITVDYTGMNVPYCTWVTIDVEFVLNDWNTVRFEDVYFTYPLGTNISTYYLDMPAVKAVPNIGWQVAGIARTYNRLASDQLQSYTTAYDLQNLTSTDLLQDVTTIDRYDSPGDDTIIYADGIIPERGFIVASYDILDADGNLIAVDKLVHEFDEKVEFGTHFLTVSNDDVEMVQIRDVKYGFSEGYLTKSQLEAFDNWTNKVEGTKELLPNQSLDYTLRIYPMPEVAQIDPAEAQQGETLNVKIAGKNFVPESTLEFSGSGITVNSLNLVSATELEAEITIAGNAETGMRHVLVINPGERIGVLHNAFEVLPVSPVIPPVPSPIIPPRYPYYPYYPGTYNYSPQTYYQSPPTYNNFNYSPVTSFGIPSFGTIGKTMPTYMGTPLSSSISSFSQSPFAFSINPYNSLLWSFGGGVSSSVPSYTYVGPSTASGGSSTWSFVSNDTSSVIGNSPHTSNFTFGADYDRVNITINSDQSYILNY